MPYAKIGDLPDAALGSNGELALIVSPVLDSSEFWASSTTTTNAQRIENLPVFRTGRFKDSRGRQQDIDKSFLEALVSNFYALREKGILVDVPVRENHSRDVRMVGGYFADLRVATTPDAKGRYMLYADLEITEPDMYARYERKTYRSRSIEISAYEDNDGQVHYPVTIGLAFCDIAAVEGLFAASLQAYASTEKPEINVFADEVAQGSDTLGADATKMVTDELNQVVSLLHQTAQKLVGNQDAAIAVHKVIQAVEAVRDGTIVVAANQDSQVKATGAQMTTMNFTAPDGQAVEIEVDDNAKELLSKFAAALTEANGQVATLTTEVESLREKDEKNILAAREAAVDRWLNEKKITPAEVDSEKAFVKMLTEDQFTAREAIIAARPVLAFTAEHDGGSGGEKDDTLKDKIASARQQYAMLVSTGVTGDKLLNSKAAQFLAANNALPEA